MSGAGEKTEQPTARRLSEARKEGQVAKSNDFNAAMILIAIALLLHFYGSYMFEYIARLARLYLSHQLKSVVLLDENSFVALFSTLMTHIVTISAPFMIGALIFGVGSNVIQVRPLFTMKPLMPNFKKLNPLDGLKRMVSIKSVVELVKGVLKMTVIGAAGFAVVNGELDHLLGTTHMNFAQSWMLVFTVAFKICVTIAILMFLIGIGDWWFQHFQLMKQLRMTKQEVKEEHKNMEGNPMVKQKIRETGRSFMRKKMLSAVPLADVVVTNPTHFAVAIQYDPDTCPAPKVVAKGADHLAFKIREIAKENNIPIMENKPLAQGLYKMVEVDHMIPPELFVAVAEVLALVFKRHKGRSRKWTKKPST